MRRFFARLGSFLFRSRAERDLAREIDSHLALLQDEFERRRMTPNAASFAARRAYGGVEQSKELHRDERSFLWLEQLLQDLGHACRGLARKPGFTAVYRDRVRPGSASESASDQPGRGRGPPPTCHLAVGSCAGRELQRRVEKHCGPGSAACVRGHERRAGRRRSDFHDAACDAGGRGMADVLYGVPFYDPVTFIALSGFVLGIAALASGVPARRALKVDPMTALRYE